MQLHAIFYRHIIAVKKVMPYSHADADAAQLAEAYERAYVDLSRTIQKNEGERDIAITAAYRRLIYVVDNTIHDIDNSRSTRKAAGHD